MRRILALTAALLATAPVSAALAPGAKAPDFTTRGAIAGKVFQVNLAHQLKKGPVVLYFFPAANTKGCNAEAAAFAQAIPDFKAAGATVIGMSADTVETLTAFSAKECAGQFAVASAGPSVVEGYDVALGREISRQRCRPARGHQPHKLRHRARWQGPAAHIPIWRPPDISPTPLPP